MAELTVLVPLGDRQVEMRKPTDGALVVMARVTRSLPDGPPADGEKVSDAARDKLVRNLGTLAQIVDSLIVKDADRDWLDESLIDGTVSAEQIFEAVRESAEKFGQARGGGPTKPAEPVRRRAR